MFCLTTLLGTTSYGQLKANFSADNLSGCNPLIVHFQDLSTGGATSWQWDLGNGATSFQPSPTTTYLTPGSYTIKLIVQNASGGKDSLIKTNYIVVNDAPSVNFVSDKTSGCYPLNVQFTDISIANSGTNVEWFWDFGDGNTSTLQNPAHTYLIMGNFGVTLKVKNSTGCTKILNKQNFVNISGGTKSSFSVGATTGCGVPAVVGFTNSSTGTGTLSYQWFFGDGGSSTQVSPTHPYTASGNYTVTLITSNNQGCSDTLIKTNAINIGTVAAAFTSTGVCAGSPVVFSNTSTPAPTSVTWYFDDGTTSTQLSPIKVFTAPNTYNVKLVADFGSCKDSVTHVITIQPKPVAAFTQSATGACSPPLNVVFTNTSVGGSSYQWAFGDGATSPQTNPPHTYLQNGSFDVTLVATNALGCTDTLKKAGAVKINPPNILSLTGGVPYSGCAPYAASFGATIDTPEPISIFEWNFGDGTPVQNGSNPQHTYVNPGSYGIQLIVTSIGGCKDTFFMPDAVKLSVKPHANFSATPLNACAQDVIHFTDLSTGTIDIWNWSFGDGGHSTSQNPQYNYTDTGYFNVMLVVQSSFCKDTLKLNNYIYINPPIAKFDKIFNCDTPLQRRFIDQSKGAVTYNWDFGDGGQDNIPNPVHVYAASGIYKVKLTVSNGTCTHSTTDTLRINDGKPNFTVNGSSFCKYADVIFTATNIDTALITNYQWFYGDGSFESITHNPVATHNYTHSGTVTPSLVTTDILGCKDSANMLLPVVIYGPTAGFSNTPAGTCIHGTIFFTDTSATDGIHPITQWIWDYDDSFKDTLTASGNSQHQFNVTGSFAIKLFVKDNFGCYDTVVKPAAILITKPVANFNSPDTIKCANSNVLFNNTSQGINLTYSWDFGDLSGSTNLSPQHAYADTGRYSIKLAIADLFGCTDTIYKPLYIHVANPKATFNFLQGDSLGLCYPFLIEVANQAANAQSVSWSFGDGGTSNLDTPSHFYNYVGTYPLTLKAYGFGGCVDSATTKVVVRGPTGSFSYAPLKFCAPDTVHFTAFTKNNATFVWDFSDGNIVTTPDSLVSHVFQAPGLFKPKMILIDAAGCQVLITGADTINVAGVDTHIQLPQAQFCDSVHVNFVETTIATNDAIAGYVWSFGDGTTSTQQHPQHFYPVPGNYSVTLTVTTSLGCKDLDSLVAPIKIVQTPIIKIDGDSVACVRSILQYKGTVVKSDTSAITWNWNLSNGNTSTLQNPPPQSYATAGTYLITAISSNASGCADTVKKNILIHPLPNTDAGPDSVVCKGQSIVLKPTGADSYIWKTDPTLSCTNCGNTTATPDSIQWYRVTGYNSFGCFLADSVLINVIEPFKIKVSPTDTLCVGESSQLLATGAGADNFVWSPTTGLSNPNINNPIATPTVTTTYQVVATDKRNCFSQVGNVVIKVYPIPQFNIVETVIKANVGSTVPILTTSSPDITAWKWLPERLLTCINCPIPNAIIKENIKYVAEASNEGGCKTRDEVTIETLCSNTNIFIPNTFSPNGDGVNDVFYPRGKGLFKVKSLRIFNRWGEIVFSRDNFAPNDASQGWDGSYKGVKLSADVYVYTMEVLCDNNQVIPLKGDITLLK